MTTAHDSGLALLSQGSPLAHLLSNGRYHVIVTAAGSGYSSCDSYALSRWNADRTVDGDGFFLYVSEPSTRNWWSAGYEPSRQRPDRYQVTFAPGSATIARRDDEIESRLEIIVPPGRDCEWRRLTLVNHSQRPRTVQVTSLVEVALNHPRADAAHPAFSKLFITTERLADRPVLLARRRPRGADEQPVWLSHGLTIEGTASAGSVETDRARFLGRGRSASNPIGLESAEPLSGTVGNVLDPVASIRQTLTIPPGGQARLMATLAFARARERVVELAQSTADWEGFHASATRRETDLRLRLGIDASLAADLPRLTGALLYGHRQVDPLKAPPDHRRIELIERVDRWWTEQGLTGEVDQRLLGGRHEMLSSLIGFTEADRAVLAGAQRLPAAATSSPRRSSGPTEPLREWNGTGGFNADGSEYLIVIGADGRRPPLPWTNVMANQEFGTVLSESGAATTWCGNSREHRLTPWFNDPVSDPHGEAIYLRDEESGAYWSPTPGPCVPGTSYQVRHGMGYTRFSTDCDGLRHELTQFVPTAGTIKVSHLRVTNTGSRPRRLAVYWYAQLVLGGDPRDAAMTTSRDQASGAIMAVADEARDFPGRVAFAALFTPTGPALDATADRTAFLGRHGRTDAPSAVITGGALDDATGRGLDHCAALRGLITIEPGQTGECSILLGEGASATEASALIEAWQSPEAMTAGLNAVRRFWRETVTGLQVRTPVPALDLMINGWLAYQNLSCRMWGRTAFYQSGGAFGFRDQLQDSLALLPLNAEIPRRQILLHAAHQFVEGDVLHWWHPPAGKGIRTRFADDLLWLPLLTAQYVEQTGDHHLLDEPAGFLRAAPLSPGEDEIFLTPARDGGSGSVYEHCCRALDRSLSVGEHGLPLFGTGDWNDGMNRVGREGRGESVWMGFFLARTLEQFAPLAEQRGDGERAARYRAHRTALVGALNQGGWDGHWYRRGYFDDGTPLGSAQNEECRIDAIAQAWAVLSGVAPADRAAEALAALEANLVSEADGIIRLLTPPFDRMTNDPGYIKGYLPGVRENGGQYTHGALWAVQALAEAGQSDRAAQLLTMISPVTRARDAAAVSIYQVEPYVIAADVYGVAPHVGRGGWTWYTGSAGWMFRVAVESILGVALEGGRTLVVRPCLPTSWAECLVSYRLPDGKTCYRISIRRSNNPSARQSAASVDGKAIEATGDSVRIALMADGAEHQVNIIFGHGARLNYRQRP